MKKSLLIILLLANSASIYAQWITGLHIQPTNPTTADMIHLYADVSFSSGSCNDKSQQQYVSGNHIYGYAIHCNGMLSYICDHTDTFMVNPLPAGNYTFVFNVDAGGAPSPCTPGIVAGPTDSIHFTVTSVTSINTNSTSQPEIYLNTSTNIINVDLMNSNYAGKEIQLFNILGKMIISRKIQGSKFNININPIPDGVYIVKINDASVPFTTRILKRN